jgi:hypothetical protein
MRRNNGGESDVVGKINDDGNVKNNRQLIHRRPTLDMYKFRWMK